MATAIDPDERWVAQARRAAHAFATRHNVAIRTATTAHSALFEIGVFHALIRMYQRMQTRVELANLTPSREFRYLTTPSGNPANFSYVSCRSRHGRFTIRQQVRVQSHLSPHINFTPDICVLRDRAAIRGERSDDYAGGRRRFFFAASHDVIAVHECKSMTAFPELIAGFVGMAALAHPWIEPSAAAGASHGTGGGHLAPTLFVGGSGAGPVRRMGQSLSERLPLNIIIGFHRRPDLLRRRRRDGTLNMVSGLPTVGG